MLIIRLSSSLSRNTMNFKRQNFDSRDTDAEVIGSQTDKSVKAKKLIFILTHVSNNFGNK